MSASFEGKSQGREKNKNREGSINCRATTHAFLVCYSCLKITICTVKTITEDMVHKSSRLVSGFFVWGWGWGCGSDLGSLAGKKKSYMSFLLVAWVAGWGWGLVVGPPKKSSKATTVLPYGFLGAEVLVLEVAQKELLEIVSCFCLLVVSKLG